MGRILNKNLTIYGQLCSYSAASLQADMKHLVESGNGTRAGGNLVQLEGDEEEDVEGDKQTLEILATNIYSVHQNSFRKGGFSHFDKMQKLSKNLLTEDKAQPDPKPSGPARVHRTLI